MSKYAETSYNDLKKEVAARGLKPENNSKENLIAALEANDGTDGAGTPPAPEAPAPTEADNAEAETPIINPAVEKKGEREAERAWRNDRQIMKDRLAKQPKVSVFIPFQEGENPQQAARIPFVVNLNGYRVEVPRGVMVEVPMQIHGVIRERLESEGRLGREHMISGNPDRENALL